MQRERPISALSVLEELAQADAAPEDQKESESRDVLIRILWQFIRTSATFFLIRVMIALFFAYIAANTAQQYLRIC